MKPLHNSLSILLSFGLLGACAADDSTAVDAVDGKADSVGQAEAPQPFEMKTGLAIACEGKKGELKFTATVGEVKNANQQESFYVTYKLDYLDKTDTWKQDQGQGTTIKLLGSTRSKAGVAFTLGDYSIYFRGYDLSHGESHRSSTLDLWQDTVVCQQLPMGTLPR